MRVPQTKHRVEFENGVPRVHLDGGDPAGRLVPNLVASGDNNTKTRKNVGYLAAGLSMAPHKTAGVGNVCGNASPACVAGCLNHQGLASVFATIAAARESRTVLWYQERQWFLDTLRVDLERWQRKADRVGMELCVRLNMFSDIKWERFGIPQDFPRIQFYDYTKHPGRVGALLPNYWLTFSRSEANHSATIATLQSGANVAAVFYQHGKFVGNRSGRQQLPKTWHGYPVIDGDTTDLRFDDPRGATRGRVIGLRLKAHSKAERAAIIASGFAIKARG
ncbi:hypothetical protein RRSWK_06469 [Rhodopirellula sp. SWK7]|nr:hypothetical protein RRSWK_06469 [Rhodopirellula sp. SWK7]